MVSIVPCFPSTVQTVVAFEAVADHGRRMDGNVIPSREGHSTVRASRCFKWKSPPRSARGEVLIAERTETLRIETVFNHDYRLYLRSSLIKSSLSLSFTHLRSLVSQLERPN